MLGMLHTKLYTKAPFLLHVVLLIAFCFLNAYYINMFYALFALLLIALSISIFVHRWTHGLKEYLFCKEKKAITDQLQSMVTRKTQVLFWIAAFLAFLWSFTICALLWYGLKITFLGGGAILFLWTLAFLWCLVFPTIFAQTLRFRHPSL